MNVIKIKEYYEGWNSEYSITDEFGNNAYLNTGIEIYDAKDGNVVKVYSLGNAQEVYDEYFTIGANDAFDYEIASGCGHSEEDIVAYEARNKKRHERQKEILPQLLKALRELLPESIELMVDDRTLDEYMAYEDESYNWHEFVLVNDIDDVFVTNDDNFLQDFDVYFYDDEWDVIEQPCKEWIAHNDKDTDDLTELLSTKYPKHWERIQRHIKKELINRYGEDNMEKIDHLMKGRIFCYDLLPFEE